MKTELNPFPPASTQATENWQAFLGTQNKLLSSVRTNNLIALGAAVSNYFAIRSQTGTLASAIANASEQQIAAARSNAEYLADSIAESGERISEAVYDSATMIDSRLQLVIDQLRIGNTQTQTMIELLQVPDFQKERRYYIEQGLKHYANARFDDTLYEHALHNFREAEKREPTDFRVLQRIGLIHLYSPGHCDLPQAEKYLEQAARYASIETRANAQHPAETSALTALTAEILGQLSLACFAQSKLAEAQQHIRQAITLQPQKPALHLQLLRVLATSQDATTSDVTNTLLELEPHAARLLADDALLVADPGIQHALQRQRQAHEAQKLTQARALIQNLQAIPACLHDLRPAAMSRVQQSIADFKQATSVDQQLELATELQQQLHTPSPEFDLGDEALVSKVPFTGQLLTSVLSDSGAWLAVVQRISPETTRLSLHALHDPHASQQRDLDKAQWPTKFGIEYRWQFSADERHFYSPFVAFLTDQLNAPPYFLSNNSDGLASPIFWLSKGELREQGMCWIGKARDDERKLLIVDAASKQILHSARMKKGEELLSYPDIPQMILSSNDQEGDFTQISLWKLASGQRQYSLTLRGKPRRTYTSNHETHTELQACQINADGSRLLARVAVKGQTAEYRYDDWVVLFDLTTQGEIPITVRGGHVGLFAFDSNGQVLQVPLDSALGRRAASGANATTAAGITSSDTIIVNRQATLACHRTAQHLELIPVPRPASLLEFLTLAAHALAFNGSGKPVANAAPASTPAPTPVPQATASEQTPAAPPDPATLLAQRIAEQALITPEARTAYEAGSQAERQEDSRLFRRKDYTSAIDSFTQALELGHPWAKTAWQRVKNKQPK
ncbi:hypothetical protein MIZ03_3390 [Rhodoferax lithotrophicus]|uniref:Tetratricopeptide repeat protein n=1 Tax=Rhodoferax lithotrophicus TaxID=2798804 RepID=A0ABM7MQB1_9BURK|nr:hypothetical protein [Rhodoferax sp. MIZ03]BCO28484.1 hypothetical protein MIZ03_3390 [Rhodoferax sp. MIZ03]